MAISKKELLKYLSADTLALNSHLFTEQVRTPEPARKNKYGAQVTLIDGIRFDSKKEAQRYIHLKDQVDRGEISDLQRQVRFVLQEAFVDRDGHKQQAITYAADFVYRQQGILIIEDVKSGPTARSESFRLRWRLLLYKFRDDLQVRCVIHDN